MSIIVPAPVTSGGRIFCPTTGDAILLLRPPPGTSIAIARPGAIVGTGGSGFPNGGTARWVQWCESATTIQINQDAGNTDPRTLQFTLNGIVDFTADQNTAAGTQHTFNLTPDPCGNLIIATFGGMTPGAIGFQFV